LRRAPGFVVTVSLTLALGLGANAAIFSLLDRLFLLPPAGVSQPERIHRVYRVDPARPIQPQHDAANSSGPAISSVFSHDDFDQLRQTLPRGARLAGYSTNPAQLGRGDAMQMLNTSYVLADYFAVLGVKPLRGRFFQGNERDIATPTPVVVISEALWRGRFASRADIVGLTVDMKYHPVTIIGVAPAPFRGADNDAADAWLPMNMMGSRRGGAGWYKGGHGAWIRILATTSDVAGAAALEHAATLAFRQTTFRPDSLATATLAPLIEAALPGFDHPEVTIATRLSGVAAIILLIACANVGNLFLARGITRRREIALRLALGVSRQRLLAMLLLEALVVALIGAAIAVVIAIRGAAFLRAAVMPEVHWTGAAVNLRVLVFTIALALLTGLGAALVPALAASRPDLAGTLKGGARDGVFQRSRVRTTLLVAQAALSILLLAGAGLFVRSLHSVETEKTGYDIDQVVYASVDVDPDFQDRAKDITQRLPALADRIRRLPGVAGTALAWMAPMEGMSWLDLFTASGDSMPHVAAQGPFVMRVSPEFFGVVGMHMIGGRPLRRDDRYGDGLSMVVNETMARSYWPGRSAIGECLVLDERGSRCVPIVGVVSDAHYDGIIEKPVMQFYLPLADTGQRNRAGVIAVRTSPGAAPAVAARIRNELRPMFSGWAEVDAHAMGDDLLRELRPWKVGAALFSAAGLLALLVAIVGIYSTISYTFAQRTHEIGVRMALGAPARRVASLVVGAGVSVVFVGVLIGLGLTLAAGRVVESMLYRTSAHDPVVLVGAAVSLLSVAAVACLVPAWRALRVDPIIALRAE
jgi:predicted permease